MEEPRRFPRDRLAASRDRFEAEWLRVQRRRRPRRPGEAGEPTPVEPPRSPTLSGGAAATID